MLQQERLGIQDLLDLLGQLDPPDPQAPADQLALLVPLVPLVQRGLLDPQALLDLLAHLERQAALEPPLPPK